MKLAKDEVVFHELKPSPKQIVIWFFTKCLTHGLATAAIPGFTWWIYATIVEANRGVILDAYDFFLLVAALLMVLGTALSFIYNRYLLASITYVITDRRCVWKGGIVRKVEHTVSFHKITDVECSRNLVEQILGLSTINLFTPGTSSMRVGAGAKSQTIPELRFEGLLESEDVAETINEQVRRYGGTQP